MSTGGAFTCALTDAGELYCWGANPFGQLGIGTTTNASVPAPVQGGQRFETVSAGASHACAAERSGGIYCWGNGALGQLGTGTSAPSSIPVQVPGIPR
ncbi:MAG: hypothetical protein EA350_09580 [Gemmatimonadales bacterium]|nr:MAG: hypothetical protein EA350_09580 [Gemmatimonadales bacterium]